jgi:membrane fusion protein (multidrug efflux system)
MAIEALGTTHARESVLITSRVNGRVSRIFLTEGAHANAGDPIVLLEDDMERASVRSATAAAAEALSQLERLESLAERRLVSQFELDRQRRSVEAAEAELELSRVLLDQRTIRAPFAGIVGIRQVSPGTLVQPGTTIVSLDACDEMRVQFSVPETLLASVQPNDEVEAVTAAYPGRTYLGRITTRGTRIDETTRAVPAQATFDNRDGSLLPGMMLMLRIQARPRQLTFVPEAALAPENGRQFVWQIDATQSVQRVPVEIGVREHGWVEIVSGVEPGHEVVVEGSGNLREGATVRRVPRPGAIVSLRNETT